jgi:hypothetical protein
VRRDVRDSLRSVSAFRRGHSQPSPTRLGSTDGDCRRRRDATALRVETTHATAAWLREALRDRTLAHGALRARLRANCDPRLGQCFVINARNSMAAHPRALSLSRHVTRGMSRGSRDAIRRARPSSQFRSGWRARVFPRSSSLLAGPIHTSACLPPFFIRAFGNALRPGPNAQPRPFPFEEHRRSSSAISRAVSELAEVGPKLVKLG